MRAVDFLQQPIPAVGQPGEDRVMGDEAIELVAMDDQQAFAAAV